METARESLRERTAAFFRWMLGRDMVQRQRQYEEQTMANGVIRQTLDPDHALAQQQLAGPWRAGEEQSLAQRLFDQQAQRTVPSAQAQEFVAQITAMQKSLEAQRQAEQEMQRRGREHGR
jgi:hypothetical protein